MMMMRARRHAQTFSRSATSKISKAYRGLARAVIFAFVATCIATAAGAHPHVWVTARMNLEFDKGAVTKIMHIWTFDELYTMMAIEGLDTNNDGKYDREELKSLAEENMEGLSEYGFFTLAKRGDETVKFSEPKDYWLEFENNLLTLHFTLPLSEPAAPKQGGMSITVADDSYYVAYEFAEENAVTFSGDGHAGCTATEKYLEVSDVAQSLQEAFGGEMEEVGPPGSNTVEIKC